ncbi:MAG: HNH endonuclease [Richelia sp. RM2_1_2]|nr:HNH endonuclease [Microcoleus sp. SM1_3_4]NJL79294.1 HNH endonuclease [Richelia sp. SM2_1_7]NJN09258.1 HNH endonuclease [Richelia sp. RM1_1_1]NJO63795.1 HNH endonuclease [Richelia sp. RM2_1_2]
MQNYVFVVDKNVVPLNPIRPKRARQLLNQNKAAVLRPFPFTLILKQEISNANIHPLTLKIDPGSKTTGFALLDGDKVVWLGELEHRGQRIKDSLEKRRTIRRNRRSRKTRYRKARFLHRTGSIRPLPPSVHHRALTVETWLKRFTRFVPINKIAIEQVKFDMAKMQNAEITGVEYQQGTLWGYEVREYLLEKWGRECTYCGKKDVPLQIEHIVPKSKGGSNRVSNLCLACEECNQKKGNKPVEEFLKNKLEKLKKIKSKMKTPLKDAAAVNASRNKLAWICEFIISGITGKRSDCEVGTGAQTKYNRTRLGLPKEHSIDAACVGSVDTLEFRTSQPLLIKAAGHRNKQYVRMNKFGFPASKPRKKYDIGWKTGDIAISINKGVKCLGRVLINDAKRFEMRINGKRISGKYGELTKLHRSDGYSYSFSANYSVSP